jgi:hypothetical protein
MPPVTDRASSSPQPVDGCDIGACLVGVDLQEHVADAQRHAIVVGENDPDLSTAAIIATGPPASPDALRLETRSIRADTRR